MGRKALLLGIDNYVAEKLRLHCPRNDVHLLAGCLAGAGYAGAIDVRVSSKGQWLTTQTMRTAIRDALKAAEPGDELLIYLSGHGVDQGGDRIVLPCDYDPDDPPRPENLLTDEAIYKQARESRAGSVVVIVDSCREGVKLALAPDLVAKGSAAVAPAPPDPRESCPTIGLVFSAEPGMMSWADDGENGVSYFTRAFAEALADQKVGGRLDAVVAATARRLADLLPAGQRQRPFLPDRFLVPGRLGKPGELIVKEDAEAQLRRRLEMARLWTVLRALPLWPRVEEGGPGLALQLRSVALDAEAMIDAAAARLPEDRWRSEAALRRLWDGLALLLPPAAMRPEEAALCVAVPLVHEAVLAGLVLRLAEAGSVLNPSVLSPRGAAPAGTGKAAGLAARAWRQSLDRDEDWQRRREHLSRGSGKPSATDILTWQLWNFAQRAGELWTYQPKEPAGPRGWLNDMLGPLLAPAPLPEVAADPRIAALLAGRELVHFAWLMLAEPEVIEGEATKARGGLDRERIIGRGGAPWRVNELEIAHLLALAAGLALDARRLPDLVAEHLGLDPGFDLPAVQEELDRAGWQERDGTLVLALETSHPAMHAALSQVAAGLERHRHRLLLGRCMGAERAEALPRAILDTRLLAATDAQDRPCFDQRHMRFTLDQNRVLRLLMGHSLYGDPKLAVREMYQNALDACRYRRAREALLAKGKGRESAYRGRIVLSATWNFNDAGTVACEDNGIGMGERHLRELFAHAGRRFTDSHEFHIDQAQWQEAGIPFWPNSRFGIGVLSYFMLAEEIEIETRRIEPDGLPAPEGLSVRVAGSGSLFRVTRDRAIRPEGGTRVTLFLKDPKQYSHALVTCVQEWLMLPEVETVLELRTFFQPAETRTLSAGAVAPDAEQVIGPLLPVGAARNSLGHPRIHWNPGQWVGLEKAERTRNSSDSFDLLLPSLTLAESRTPILVDGIRASTREVVPALLVNLSEDWAGEVSVDRREVAPPPNLQKLLLDFLVQDAGEALLRDPRLDSAKLARLAAVQPEALCSLDDRLRAAAAEAMPVRPASPLGHPLPPGAGLSIHDRHVEAVLARKPGAMKQAVQPLLAERLRELSATPGHGLPWLDQLGAFLARTAPRDPAPLAAQLVFHFAVNKRPRGSNVLPGSASDALPMHLGIGSVARAAANAGWPLRDVLSNLRVLAGTDALLFEPDRFLALPNGDLASVQSIGDEAGFTDRLGFWQLLALAKGSGKALPDPAALRRLHDAGLVIVAPDAFAGLREFGALAAELVSAAETDAPSSQLAAASISVPAVLQAMTSNAELPAGKLEATLSWLATLGVAGADPALPGQLATLGPDPLRMLPFSAKLDGAPPFKPRATGADLLLAGLKNGLEFRALVEAVRPLAALGAVEADLDAFAEFRPGDRLRAILTEEELEPFTRHRRIDAGWLFATCIFQRLTLAEAACILAPLQPLGVVELDLSRFRDLPDTISDIWIIRLMSYGLDDEPPYRRTLDLAHLRRAAIALRRSYADMVGMAALPARIGIVDGDPETLRTLPPPHPRATELLSRDLDGKAPWRTRLSAVDLAVAAHLLNQGVSQLALALDDLKGAGVDVEEARAFAATVPGRAVMGGKVPAPYDGSEPSSAPRVGAAGAAPAVGPASDPEAAEPGGA